MGEADVCLCIDAQQKMRLFFFSSTIKYGAIMLKRYAYIYIHTYYIYIYVYILYYIYMMDTYIYFHVYNTKLFVHICH